MTDAPSPTAVLFDIDGTLVDSNFLHVDAWAHAFAEKGLTVPSWRIQRAIGADSSELLDQLLGEDRSDELTEAVKGLHDDHYTELAPRLQILDRATDLVAAIKAHGARVVLATSAPKQELDRLLELLDIDDDIYAVTSAEDVEKAKPAPDVISVALESGGVEAANAIMIGDAVWDIQAAKTAGVEAIGLLSGGTGEGDLREAGAVEVYADVAHLLEELETSAAARLWAS